jgi:hypothetical protein
MSAYDPERTLAVPLRYLCTAADEGQANDRHCRLGCIRGDRVKRRNVRYWHKADNPTARLLPRFIEKWPPAERLTVGLIKMSIL